MASKQLPLLQTPQPVGRPVALRTHAINTAIDALSEARQIICRTRSYRQSVKQQCKRELAREIERHCAAVYQSLRALSSLLDGAGFAGI